MARLWIVLRRKQKIWKQAVVEVGKTEGCEAVREALTRACAELDIPRPIWLAKNESDMEAFGRSFFTQDHFIEAVEFDRLELEWLREGAKSRDPRNDFS
ncbi:MAG: hypothetical protein LBD02_03485 [Christensenellaceae bacterium]|jgi:hypothetical protein|nr:hypothetical protein [Christensenellaceae bacterium]